MTDTFHNTASLRLPGMFVLFLFYLCVIVPPAGADPLKTPDHAPWGRLLQSRLTEGEGGAPNRFDYGGLKASPEDRAALKAYIASLEAVDPEALSRDEAFAFWVNLYNALTVEVVVEHYPIASIRDIDISPGLFSNGFAVEQCCAVFSLARRHRARHSPARIRRPPRPLCRQLRLRRLPRSRGRALPGRRPRRDAR